MSVDGNIRTALAARLNTVANIGQVYGRERFTSDQAQFRNLFVGTVNGVANTLLGWTIGTSGVAADPNAFASTLRLYTYIVRGYYGFQDSGNTESTFVDLVEAVLNALDGRTDLGVAGVISYGVGPAGGKIDLKMMFGSFLVHACEIEVRVNVDRDTAYVAG